MPHSILQLTDFMHIMEGLQPAYAMSTAAALSWRSHCGMVVRGGEGSTSTTGTPERVPGLWSLRCPVIQAFSVFSCLLRGRTCTTQSLLAHHASVHLSIAVSKTM